ARCRCRWSCVTRQANPARLPACRGRKKIAIGGAHVTGRGEARAAAQHHLVAHELAVVFADGADGLPVTGVRGVGALRPLPDVAVGSGAGRTGMKASAVGEMTDHGLSVGGVLPFLFGG